MKLFQRSCPKVHVSEVTSLASKPVECEKMLSKKLAMYAGRKWYGTVLDAQEMFWVRRFTSVLQSVTKERTAGRSSTTLESLLLITENDFPKSASNNPLDSQSNKRENANASHSIHFFLKSKYFVRSQLMRAEFLCEFLTS